MSVHLRPPYKTVMGEWRPGKALCGLATNKSLWTSGKQKVTCRKCLTSLAWVSAQDSNRRALEAGYNEDAHK